MLMLNKHCFQTLCFVSRILAVVFQQLVDWWYVQFNVICQGVRWHNFSIAPGDTLTLTKLWNYENYTTVAWNYNLSFQYLFPISKIFGFVAHSNEKPTVCKDFWSFIYCPNFFFCFVFKLDFSEIMMIGEWFADKWQGFRHKQNINHSDQISKFQDCFGPTIVLLAWNLTHVDTGH